MTTNRRFWEGEERKLDERIQAATWPGGQKAVDRLAKQGKLPVRQLIEMLVDLQTEFYELSQIAGFGMNYPDGIDDVPCGGVVTGIGRIHGNWTMIFANDSRVKAGTYFPITLKKHMRAQAIAERCGLNCVYIADSGGAFLPMQADVFPDDGHFGSMFYNMARMSAMGLKQITLSTGGNTAGGAYIVFMACQSIMIDRMSYSFLGGPPLVKMATGEEISAEDLGGARVHTHVSGGADHFCANQEEAVRRVREILALEPPQKIYAHRYAESPPSSRQSLYDLMPPAPHQGINGRAILEAIADDSIFYEYKKNYAPGWGDNILAGKIRIKGIPVGIIASNSVGIIFAEAARKAAEWIVRCSYDKVPLLFVQSAPGYMVGSDSEHRGIGKYGSDMVRAVSCSQVPRIQLVIGPDNGAANYGMCGRAYKPHFIFHTMRSRTGVMSGRSAAGVLLSIEERKREARGKPMTAEEKQAFREMMIERYDGEAHPFYCGARILNDSVLKFSQVRDWLAMALEVSLLQPIGEPSFGNFRF